MTNACIVPQAAYDPYSARTLEILSSLPQPFQCHTTATVVQGYPHLSLALPLSPLQLRPFLPSSTLDFSTPLPH